MPPRLTLDLVRQLAEAVAHAHDRGVLHGSLRPEVVWITNQSQIRVAGFGCPIQFEELDSEAVARSAGFLAPEQAGKRGAVGRATDIYGLGALLYAMATGGPPHRAASVDETLRLIRMRQAVKPSRLRPGLPEELDIICTKCLRVNPSNRYGPDRPMARLIAELWRSTESANESSLIAPIGRWLRRHGRIARASLLILAFALVPALWDRQRRQIDWDVISTPDANFDQYDLAERHFERSAMDQPFDSESAAGLSLARFRTGRMLFVTPVETLAWRRTKDEWTAIHNMTNILIAIRQHRYRDARSAFHSAEIVGYKPISDVEQRLFRECEHGVTNAPNDQ